MVGGNDEQQAALLEDGYIGDVSDDENNLLETEIYCSQELGCPRATLTVEPSGLSEEVQQGCPRATLRAQSSGLSKALQRGCSRATLRAQTSGRYKHSVQPGCSRATLRAKSSGQYVHNSQTGCSRATLRPSMGGTTGYADDMVAVQERNEDQVDQELVWDVWCAKTTTDLPNKPVAT